MFCIYLTVFSRLLQGQPIESRRAMISEAFESLHAVEPFECKVLAQLFRSHNHPDVLDCLKTPDDVSRQFIASFTLHSYNDQVTRHDFVEYYTSVSACIDDDYFFERLLCGCWDMPPRHTFADVSRVNMLAVDITRGLYPDKRSVEVWLDPEEVLLQEEKATLFPNPRPEALMEQNKVKVISIQILIYNFFEI